MTITSCSSASSQEDTVSQNSTVDSPQSVSQSPNIPTNLSVDLSSSLARAIQQLDYRLLVPATRGISVPGLDPKEFEQAIALCGKKYMTKTGDVIKSEHEREDRKKVIAYMRLYNESMWLVCQSKKLSQTG